MLNLKFSAIILRLLSRLFGLGLLILSFVFTLSLISFNSEDSSFNTVSTDDHISNWIGSFGSHFSDLSFQLIGFSSFILCLIIFALGLKISSRAGSRHLLPKLIITPFCILCFSVVFAALPQPNWWEFNSLGGVNGHFILAKTAIIPIPLTLLLALFLGVASLSIIIEISFADWIYFIRYSIATGRFFLNKLLGERRIRKIPQAILPKVVKQDEPEQIPEESQEQEDDIEILKKKLKAPKTKKPTRSAKSSYELPEPDLLTDRSSENKDKKTSRESVESQGKMLTKVLEDFGVYGTSLGAKVGPVVTLHEFEPAAGTKASRVIGLSDDISRSMSAVSARIAVVPGKTSLGIELPNPKREMIFLRELLESKDYKLSQDSLPIILGKDIAGDTMIADLARMPHLLIAGTTGSGKSVGLNVMILSLLFKLRPDECKFIMIDPKMLELSIYDGIPHLLSPVVTEPGKAVIALKWVVAEMEERYRLMSSFAVRNISGYNEKAEKAILGNEKLVRKVQTGYDPSNGQPIIEEIEFEPKKLPFIVVIVDEMADLMLVAGKEIENSVQRLAQMARAAGIHIIMATQRPSVDVITGIIKANFPTRISFQVTSRIDSRTILGAQGAEQLLGHGDMIYMSGGSKMTRVHGPFCSDTEIENVVNFIKNQDRSEFGEDEKISFEVPIPISGGSDEDDFGGGPAGGSDEDLYRKAVMIVRRDKKPSISYVQRQLRIGYNRAATLIEKMEEEGVVSAPSIAGKREVIEE
ncbi:MAG: DNA translocase FtsK 4TM domain-containing protein [Proteobacteria bacterium]|nr:DNA translocase FtsK 4TM domain-containing protein [Pseudomonadota bacterium]